MSHVRFPSEMKPTLKGLAIIHGMSVEKYLESLVKREASERANQRALKAIKVN